ncbi:TPA: transposase, partial [Enterococcus faecium]|nr:transposase [Enterococcus faecium]
NPLRDYFLRYPRKVREQVRLVVSDFYTPYRTLVKECFPNARIVADRFHISQHIGRAFTNHRIQVMKTFKKGDRRSKHLKKYWRLLQKNAWELNGQHRYWRPSFRDHLTEAEIVDRLLYYDDSLKRGYEVYQVFLSAIRRQDVPEFVALLKEDYKELPEHYQPVFTTFK